MAMIKAWTETHTQKFQKDILTFEHGLRDTGLFTDEALANLLDRHPKSKLDVCTIGKDNDPKFAGKVNSCDFRGCSGKELIAAAKEGWIWINLREAMNVHAEYQSVLSEMYGDLAANTGNKPFNPRGGILITSPIARTPYHFDKTETILWHIRGRKRIYIYPLEEKYFSDEMYENVILDPIDDDLPYEPEFDAGAQYFDLQEGQAICWKLNAPHRVVNSEFCVSVTSEYSTRESGMKNAAIIANAAFRSKFGRGSTYSEQSQAGRFVRSIFGRVIKKSGLLKVEKPVDMVNFKIDPTVPGFVVETEPFERDY